MRQPRLLASAPLPPVKRTMLDEVGDPDAPAGSRSRSLWLVSEARLVRGRIQNSAKDLALVLSRLEEERAWEALNAPSYEALCEREISLDRAQVEAIRTAKKGDTVAVALERAKDAPLKRVGRPTGGGNVDNVHIVQTNRLNSNSAERILRRLQRDRPDLVQKVARGEIRSARAAAIEAGIVKVPTGLDLLLRAWERASAKERTRFLAKIGAAFSR